MKNKIFLPLLLQACVQYGQPFPMAVSIAGGNPENIDAITTKSIALNNRLGCDVIWFSDHQGAYRVEWTSLKGLANRFDTVKYDGGVSTIEHIAKADTFNYKLLYTNIWFAVEGEAPDERPWVSANPKEVGDLWMMWVGYFAGLRLQYTDPTKITYGHATNGDSVGLLLEALKENNIDLCGMVNEIQK